MRERLIHFMHGRYGNDEYNICLLLLGIICTILSHFWQVFSLFSFAFIVYAFFRMFSKNIYKRRRENSYVAPYFSYIKAKFRNRGSAKIFMCPVCKRTLRVPKNKGNITLSCPCGEKLKRKS